MRRIARGVLPGIAHHVTQRGVRSMDVFCTDGDRAAYLRLMAEHDRAAPSRTRRIASAVTCGRAGPWARGPSSRKPNAFSAAACAPAPPADPARRGNRYYVPNGAKIRSSRSPGCARNGLKSRYCLADIDTGSLFAPVGPAFSRAAGPGDSSFRSLILAPLYYVPRYCQILWMDCWEAAEVGLC